MFLAPRSKTTRTNLAAPAVSRIKTPEASIHVSRSNSTGRTIIITGAAAGVGRAIANCFARAGDRVGLISRDAVALEAVRKEVESQGAEAAFEAVDVADAPALFAAAERLEQKLGKMDIWINDAMLTVFSPVAEIRRGPVVDSG